MYPILSKKVLNPTVTQLEIEAPLVAKKAEPGQFIILRVNEDGERIPLTVAGVDPERGAVKIIFQIIGKTTFLLGKKEVGDSIADFVGPLGRATDMEGLKKVCVVGGGVGCAIALPVAEKMHSLGIEVTSIIGFRSADLLILEDEFRACSDKLIVMTDDGSYARQGNVTVPLTEMLDAGEHFDLVLAIGPAVMMKFTALAAKPYGVPCRVSMSPIMVDGTGMCGGCRLTLVQEDGTKVTKFACVDGPEFDAYQIDFDEAISRGRMYMPEERHAYDEACNLFKQAEGGK